MRNYLRDACETIDAALFSGDTLYQPGVAAELKDYFDRWQRAVAAAPEPFELVEPVATCSVCSCAMFNTPSGMVCLHGHGGTEL